MMNSNVDGRTFYSGGDQYWDLRWPSTGEVGTWTQVMVGSGPKNLNQSGFRGSESVQKRVEKHAGI